MGTSRFKTILLGYDGSEGSRKAVDMAAELARTYQASIIVLCAFHPMPRVTRTLDPATSKRSTKPERWRTTLVKELELHGHLRGDGRARGPAR